MLLNRLGQEDDESIIQDIVKEIRDKLKKINQNDVYDFYSYVEVVDRKIEATFSQKMKVVIQKFVQSQTHFEENLQDKKGCFLEANTTHVVTVKNGMIELDPPLSESKR